MLTQFYDSAFSASLYCNFNACLQQKAQATSRFSLDIMLHHIYK